MTMPRDADGREFFGFCGQRAYLPEEDPKAESISEYVLRRLRQRLLAEMLAKDKPVAGHKPANDGVEAPLTVLRKDEDGTD